MSTMVHNEPICQKCGLPRSQCQAGPLKRRNLGATTNWSKGDYLVEVWGVQSGQKVRSERFPTREAAAKFASEFPQPDWRTFVMEPGELESEDPTANDALEPPLVTNAAADDALAYRQLRHGLRRQVVPKDEDADDDAGVLVPPSTF